MYFENCKTPKDLYEAISDFLVNPYPEKPPPYRINDHLLVNPPYDPEKAAPYRWMVNREYLEKTKTSRKQTKNRVEYETCHHITSSNRILEVVYEDARSCALKFRQLNPGLTGLPDEVASNPYLGLQSMQEWCIEAEKPAETEPETARGKLWRIRAWFKALIKEAYRLAMRSFFDSAMHK